MFTGNGGSAWLVVPQALLELKAKGDPQEYGEFMKGRLQKGKLLIFLASRSPASVPGVACPCPASAWRTPPSGSPPTWSAGGWWCTR